MTNYYIEEEDTYLLYEILKQKLTSLSPPPETDTSILEIGVGGGYIISNLEYKFPSFNYYGSDINIDAVEETNKQCSNAQIKQGDLFEPFKDEKFDITYFNTPYLPCERGESFEDLNVKDKAIYGGKNGYETILEFLKHARNHMKKNAQIYMLFSNLSKPHVINEFLEKNAFIYEKIATKKLFFEELIVYKIYNREEVEFLLENCISHLSYLSRGKHSVVLQGIFMGEEIVCKIQGNGRYIEKEGIFLEKLQNENFVPKLYFYDKKYIVMEKINGIILDDIYNNVFSINDYKKIFQNILDVSQKLDQLGLQKFEMLNPYKHIFIKEDLSVKFIDFERMIYSNSPKNTTQFLEYIRRKQKRIEKLGLNINLDNLDKISKEYKFSNNKINIDEFIE